MTRMTQDELNLILDQHALYWTEIPGVDPESEAAPPPLGQAIELDSVDLGGLDLSGRELRSVRLVSCNLSGCNFSGADLSHSQLMGSDLRDALFENSLLLGADISGCIV